MKDNPKNVAAMKEGKVPADKIPFGPLADVARVMATGAEKYGVRNWRLDPVLASTYVGAIFRHAMLEGAEGSNIDADSGEHPLAHVIACCLIVMDAEAHGTLMDDRELQESKDPESGAVRSHNPAEVDDETLRAAMEPFRRYSELSRRLVECACRTPGHKPLEECEWQELERLHMKLPPGLLSRDGQAEQNTDDMGNGD